MIGVALETVERFSEIIGSISEYLAEFFHMIHMGYNNNKNHCQCNQCINYYLKYFILTVGIKKAAIYVRIGQGP